MSERDKKKRLCGEDIKLLYNKEENVKKYTQKRKNRK